MDDGPGALKCTEERKGEAQKGEDNVYTYLGDYGSTRSFSSMSPLWE